MELVLQQNPVVTWRLEAGKRMEAPKNIGEFILRIPGNVAIFLDSIKFEINFQSYWILRRLIFKQLNRHITNA